MSESVGEMREKISTITSVFKNMTIGLSSYSVGIEKDILRVMEGEMFAVKGLCIVTVVDKVANCTAL
jgi:hypothetical protein